MDMNPELVYNLVASNPGLRNVVEQTARLMQMQTQMQQMAQNPVGAINGYMSWQQQQAQVPQQPTQAPAQQQVQSQQGGQPVGMLDQAMGIVEEFRKSFTVMNNNLEEVYKQGQANAEAIKALAARLDDAPAAKGAKGKAEP